MIWICTETKKVLFTTSHYRNFHSMMSDYIKFMDPWLTVTSGGSFYVRSFKGSSLPYMEFLRGREWIIPQLSRVSFVCRKSIDQFCSFGLRKFWCWQFISKMAEVKADVSGVSQFDHSKLKHVETSEKNPLPTTASK